MYQHLVFQFTTSNDCITAMLGFLLPFNEKTCYHVPGNLVNGTSWINSNKKIKSSNGDFGLEYIRYFCCNYKAITRGITKSCRFRTSTAIWKHVVNLCKWRCGSFENFKQLKFAAECSR